MSVFEGWPYCKGMELPIADHHAVRLDMTVLTPLLRLLEAANERADALERRLAMLEPNDDKPDAPREPARETTAAALAELRARTELREEQDEPAETYSRVRGVVQRAALRLSRYLSRP